MFGLKIPFNKLCADTGMLTGVGLEDMTDINCMFLHFIP